MKSSRNIWLKPHTQARLGMHKITLALCVCACHAGFETEPEVSTLEVRSKQASTPKTCHVCLICLLNSKGTVLLGRVPSTPSYFIVIVSILPTEAVGSGANQQPPGLFPCWSWFFYCLYLSTMVARVVIPTVASWLGAGRELRTVSHTEEGVITWQPPRDGNGSHCFYRWPGCEKEYLWTIAAAGGATCLLQRFLRRSQCPDRAGVWTVQALGLGMWEDSENGLENIGLVFQNYVTYELCGLEYHFWALVPLPVKFLYSVWWSVWEVSEASEKLHGFVPGVPLRSWACEFGP